MPPLPHPLPNPFKIIVHPDQNSPLQLLSNENDAGSLTATDLFSRNAGPLTRRQTQNGIIPTGYTSQNDGPAPGVVVGIVLGSVAGFLLILWLLYTCMNFNNVSSGSSAYTESVVVRERRKSMAGTGSHLHSHAHSHRSRRTSETVEVRRDRSRTPVRIVRPEVVPPPRTERVIVEESRQTRRDRSPGASDEVVVIEEHSPPRRSKSKRESRGDPGGYRTVDPHAYGGGAAPMRGVKGSRRSSGGRS